VRGEQTAPHPRCSQEYRPCHSQDPIRAGYVVLDSAISTTTKQLGNRVRHVNERPHVGLLTSYTTFKQLNNALAIGCALRVPFIPIVRTITRTS
jgi:hypothetical protein